MRKRLLTILMLVLVFTVGTAYSSFAADEGYKYKVNVYTGNQGVFKDDGSKAKTLTFKKGDPFPEMTIKDIKVTNSKYYVRGFRVAGHDNDEGSKEPSGYTKLSFPVDTDVSYEVAYGIKGALVKYTVHYYDENGNEIAPSETYYGMPGDKPVVSFKYVEGYVPDANYKAKTLTKDGDNDFTFNYTKGAAAGGNDNGNGGGAGGNGAAGNGNGAGAANANVGPGAPGTAGNPAGANVAGNNGNNGTTTIGDNDTPLDPYQDLDEEGGLSWQMLAALGGFLTLLLLALILFLLKRRHNGEDEEDLGDDDFINMAK